MQVIPVIDIKNGLSVHARRGERRHYRPLASRLLERGSSDPVALARAYRTMLGARELYVADLDAIEGGEVGEEILRGIIGEIEHVWIDAGVTSEGQVGRLLRMGATRVIVGLETLSSLSTLRTIIEHTGPSPIVFSLDLRAGEPFTEARDLRGLGPLAIAELGVEAGVRTMILLDIARVGTGEGVDLPLLRKLRMTFPELDLVVGGGVSGWSDLDQIAGAGAQAALVGSALHDGRVGREEIEALVRYK